ncbi:CLUMA_CG005680, isoform A [Clunio marinus]|uniref:CLUMA_CG005680, isoform A n=1 Tax=Clunio marinus TaxID=568069 RepID=A0A1J1HVM0_9DIPT|nr:CLUMA_CG005680, isoform A [Clunio marinus]
MFTHLFIASYSEYVCEKWLTKTNHGYIIIHEKESQTWSLQHISCFSLIGVFLLWHRTTTTQIRCGPTMKRGRRQDRKRTQKKCQCFYENSSPNIPFRVFTSDQLTYYRPKQEKLKSTRECNQGCQPTVAKCSSREIG